MRFILSIVILLFAIYIQGQPEILVGDGIVETSLIIQKGALVVGDHTSASPKAGTIKFVNGAFMGFDGNKWLSLSPQEKYILGQSNVSSDGAFQFGNVTGLEAATAICKDSYPNEPTAHFYTAEEIDAAIGYGNINGISSLTEYWTVQHLHLGFDTSNSANNNCFSLLYETGHIAQGTTVTFFLNHQPENIVGNYTNYKYGKACGTPLRVVCGR